MRLAAVLLLPLSVAPTGTAASSIPAAEITPAPGPTRRDERLSELVKRLPQCALSCMMAANHRIGCEETDVRCFCSKANQLVPLVGPCLVATGACSASDSDDLIRLSRRICRAANNNDPREVASASLVIEGFLETAVSTMLPLATGAGSAPGESDAPGGQPSTGGEDADRGGIKGRGAAGSRPLAALEVIGGLAAVVAWAL